MGKAKPQIIKLVKDFKEKAKDKYRIKKLILFGSQTSGRSTPESDIDLLIVSNKFKNKAHFMSRLLEEWHIAQDRKHPVDFICFTEKEFNRLSGSITIVKQALEEGIEI